MEKTINDLRLELQQLKTENQNLNRINKELRDKLRDKELQTKRE